MSMWNRVSRWLGASGEPPSSAPSLLSATLGQSVTFTEQATIKALRGVSGQLIRQRHYSFGDDHLDSFILKTQTGQEFGFSLIQEDDAAYVSLSRELSTAERRAWFDPDALSFFLEKTSAQTLRCRANGPADAPWAAERYTKTVDLVLGSVKEFGKRPTSANFTYSMLLDAAGERAIEIEQYGDHGLIRMYATVFMPLYSIDLLEPSETLLHAKVPSETIIPVKNPPLFLDQRIAENDNDSLGAEEDFENPEDADTSNRLLSSAQIIPLHDAFLALSKELESMAEQEIDAFLHTGDATESASGNTEKAVFKNDFRRLEPASNQASLKLAPEPEAPVPDFLLKPRETVKEKPDQLFKKIFEPKPSQILCDTQSAKIIKAQAAQRGVSEQHILRTMIGLEKDKPTMAAFDLPLSDEDYSRLAMRYQIRPDRKDEIRKRMSQELSKAIMRAATEKTS